MKRAFTLIELLVVIAIIAILAAILFPVFAQAKEAAKKTKSLSNIKQTATSLLIYCGDVDDNMPFGLTPNQATNSWRRTGGHATPAGWMITTRYIPEEDGHGWVNSTNPYRKNQELLRIDGAPVEDLSGAPYNAPLKPVETTGMTLNGLYHGYNLGAVAQPSKSIMLWFGWGKNNDRGVAYVNPRLNCRGTGVCVFQPSAYPQPDMTDSSSRGDEWNTDSTMWVHAKGQPMVASDTSAKYRVLGANAGNPVASGNGNTDPFATYETTGIPIEMWRCYAPGALVRYSCFFRPDNEFTN